MKVFATRTHLASHLIVNVQGNLIIFALVAGNSFENRDERIFCGVKTLNHHRYFSLFPCNRVLGLAQFFAAQSIYNPSGWLIRSRNECKRISLEYTGHRHFSLRNRFFISSRDREKLFHNICPFNGHQKCQTHTRNSFSANFHTHFENY